MINVMIDLETLSFGHNAVITNIGACEFNITTGYIEDTFQRTIDWQSSLDAGHIVDSDVLHWWFNQSKKAQAEMLGIGDHLHEVLQEFKEWLPDGCCVWGNGPSFDITKLEVAYEKWSGIDSVPWKFYNVRCVRTMRMLTEGIVDRNDIPFEGEKHTALADAVWQAKYVSKMYKALKK